MTSEQLAAQLDGNEYGSEYTKAQLQLAKENNLVIVHGYSDDCMEFEGAISDEVGCYEGDEFYITKKLNVKTAKPGKPKPNVISAVWCPKDEDGFIKASWAYETKIPHSVFKIMEDEEVYCYGIVFQLNDLE